MPLNVKDMSLCLHAMKLSALRGGAQTLINNIIAESNSSNIESTRRTTRGNQYVERNSKEKFINHSYNYDPLTNGGALPTGVSVVVYYSPATLTEYDNWEVLNTALYLFSARQRILMRTADNKVSFYLTSHPKNSRNEQERNSYGNFIPINTAL